jgi:hypothetical protein
MGRIMGNILNPFISWLEKNITRPITAIHNGMAWQVSMINVEETTDSPPSKIKYTVEFVGTRIMPDNQDG